MGTPVRIKDFKIKKKKQKKKNEKTLMLGKIEGGRRRRWLDGITDYIYGDEFEQAPGVGDGQGGLVFCSSWSHKVRHD